jgi:broad specificity phosphatase PhoE
MPSPTPPIVGSAERGLRQQSIGHTSCDGSSSPSEQRSTCSPRSTAIFTHGMTKEVILCRLLGAPVEVSRSFRFDNASITELRWAQDVWVLEKFNNTDHLR